MTRKFINTIIWTSILAGLIMFVAFANEKTPYNALLFIATSFSYSIPLAFVNGFGNQWLDTKFSWANETKKRLFYGIIFIVLGNAIVVLTRNYIDFVLIQKTDPNKFFTGITAFYNWAVINVALLISAILHAKSFMEEWKKSAKKEVFEQKIITGNVSAQFESLKNQLDPHFLFNSLNVLSALIDENPQQAQQFTESMSKIYRYVLEQKDKELVTVEEELDFAKTYCVLLKTRFENSVNFVFEVDEKDKKFFVVPLSLQLLLENCIKHNFATANNPLNIKIYSEEGHLLIENNLMQREQVKDSPGIGLSNIVQRYSLLTKQHVSIEKSEDFFRVKIPILTQKNTAMAMQPTSESIAYNRASKRVKELKGFYGNLISYCLVIPFLIIVNLYTAPRYHWFWWPMLGWGIGLASHALQVFGIGRNWEEKQIRKILEKENFNK